MPSCPTINRKNLDVTDFDKHIHTQSGAFFASVPIHIHDTIKTDFAFISPENYSESSYSSSKLFSK